MVWHKFQLVACRAEAQQVVALTTHDVKPAAHQTMTKAAEQDFAGLRPVLHAMAKPTIAIMQKTVRITCKCRLYEHGQTGLK